MSVTTEFWSRCAPCATLGRHPLVNASWQEDGIHEHTQVNVGVAVALEEGLIVPVVHNAAQLGLGAVPPDAGCDGTGAQRPFTAGRRAGRHVYHQQFGHVGRGAVYGRHQPAAERHSGRGPHKQAAGGGGNGRGR
ncbi:MAG: 2-oxo acid dehydrogenase subunit E2 [Ardenticatenaceae bacterium]|nr:2-oxo acid dehydrogenase subunit E2 [Ardenticatenaceae bacterium]